MKQLQLPSVDATGDVEGILGLTNWTVTSVQPPPTVGWWKTRRKSSPSLCQPQRRWWDGNKFSTAVVPANTTTEAEAMAGIPASYGPHDLEWCGLCQPYPGEYPYKLVATPPRVTPALVILRRR